MPSDDNKRGGAVDVQIVFGREEAAMTVRFVFLLHVLVEREILFSADHN